MFKKLQYEQMDNMMFCEEAVTLEDGTKSNYVTLKFQEDRIRKPLEDNELTRACWRVENERRRINSGKDWWLNNNDDAKEALDNKRRALGSARRPRIYVPKARNPFRRITSPGKNRYARVRNHGKNPYKPFGKTKKGTAFNVQSLIEAISNIFAGTNNLNLA